MQAPVHALRTLANTGVLHCPLDPAGPPLLRRVCALRQHAQRLLARQPHDAQRAQLLRGRWVAHAGAAHALGRRRGLRLRQIEQRGGLRQLAQVRGRAPREWRKRSRQRLAVRAEAPRALPVQL